MVNRLASFFACWLVSLPAAGGSVHRPHAMASAPQHVASDRPKDALDGDAAAEIVADAVHRGDLSARDGETLFITLYRRIERDNLRRDHGTFETRIPAESRQHFATSIRYSPIGPFIEVPWRMRDLPRIIELFALDDDQATIVSVGLRDYLDGILEIPPRLFAEVERARLVSSQHDAISILEHLREQPNDDRVESLRDLLVDSYGQAIGDVDNLEWTLTANQLPSVEASETFRRLQSREGKSTEVTPSARLLFNAYVDAVDSAARLEMQFTDVVHAVLPDVRREEVARLLSRLRLEERLNPLIGPGEGMNLRRALRNMVSTNSALSSDPIFREANEYIDSHADALTVLLDRRWKASEKRQRIAHRYVLLGQNASDFTRSLNAIESEIDASTALRNELRRQQRAVTELFRQSTDAMADEFRNASNALGFPMIQLGDQFLKRIFRLEDFDDVSPEQVEKLRTLATEIERIWRPRQLELIETQLNEANEKRRAELRLTIGEVTPEALEQLMHGPSAPPWDSATLVAEWEKIRLIVTPDQIRRARTGGGGGYVFYNPSIPPTAAERARKIWYDAFQRHAPGGPAGPSNEQVDRDK